ncbi:hypothetical protein [Hydrogenophaga sp. OTU3427]|uniref:hypothetical protein n=1 Tax=Hydrogenophaga sp. OTU3427 TaxID=3043856 RepID=UPI00313B8D42
MFTPVRILLVVLLGLGVALTSLWVDEQGQPRVVAWQVPPPVDPAVPDVNALPTPSLAPPEQLLARPLFTPDRKPLPPPPPPKPAPPPDPMASVRLFGVISGETSGIIAQIDGTVKRVMLEQNIGAWKLSGIDGRKVTFVRDGESRDLMLAYNPLGAAPELPAVAAAGRAPVAGARGAAPDPAGVAERTQNDLRERQRARAELRARAGMNATP